MAGGMAAMMAGQSDLQTFNLFDRLLNESLRQSYFLGPDSYFMFWSCLTDEKLAIQFVTQLITSVVEIDELIETKKKPSKDKKSKDEHPQAIGVPLEEVGDELFGGPTDYRTSMKAARAALMSTIMFIATHFDIKASSASTDDKPMFEAIEAWKKRCTQAKATGRNEKASHTYAQFTASFVEDKASFSNEVDLMEALDAAVNVQNAKGLVCPFQMPTDIVNQNMGPAFSWHFIMKLCGEGEQKRQEVFAALMDMLRVHNTEPRLLCLLHIFTALLHSFSPWNTDQLRRLVPTLELFYFWPCPFGPLAQALAGLVERELSCPGAAMRDRFMAEVPHVDETCESGEEEEATYRVPVILEAGTANSGFLKWVAHDEIVKCGRPNSRTAMIWFLCDMIRCTCPEPLAEEAVWALSDVALEEITPLYQEACRIDLEAQAAAEQDAAAVLVRMSEIKSQLETQHGTNSPSMSAGDMMTPRARMRGQGGGMRGKGGARRESVRRTSVTTGMAARGMRRASSAPGLPADLFSSMDQAGGAEQVTIGADEMQLRLHFEPFELDCSHSSDYSYPAAMAASVGVTLRQIISSEQHVTGARSGATAASRTLKICIAGGSRTLHAYVCALVELKQSTNPADAALIEMLSSCPVSLYLLPIGSDSTDNVMGEFIARADGWYAKHILTGLASPLPIVPQLREVKVPLMTVPPFNNKPEVLSPVSATRIFVERYVREASDELMIKLFKCECWTESGGPVAFSIPFCESVEMGQTACERYQEKYSSEGSQVSPLLSASGSDIMFTFVRMGLTGETTMDPIPAPPKAVKEAVLSNVGRRDAPIAAADPTKPWLELDVSENPTSKQDACSWNEHVGELEIAVAPRSTRSGGGGGGGLLSMFHVFVDGQPYGPFTKVRCTPLMEDGSDVQQQIGIRTFFPTA